MTAVNPTRRLRLALLSLVGVVVAGVTVTLLVRRELAARRLAAVIAEIDRTDPGWRCADLECVRPTVPDAENFAIAFAAAYPKFSKPKDRAVRELWNPVVALKDELVPNVRLTTEQESMLRRHFATNAAAAPAFLALADYPRGRFPLVPAADGVSFELDHVNRMRPASTGTLVPLAFLAVHDGDIATALAVFRARLAFARSLRDEPMSASQSVRAQFQREAVNGLQRLLGHLELSADQLARIRRELTVELADDPWVLVTRDQRAVSDAFLMALRTGTVKLSTAKANMIPDYKPTPAERLSDWVQDHVSVDVDAAHTVKLEVATRLVATARRPWPERVAAADALDAELAASSVPLNWMMRGAAGRMARFLLAVRARVSTAVAAAAVEQHRVERGDWPTALPAGLPDDPYTGKPLLYRPLADGVVVYSVGPNGRDDGGTLTPEATDVNPPPDGDIGFRLWDVPHRNCKPGGEP
ncbi:MAG: hypothetical protein U0746_19870 [Gemmataceae bacterium]